MIAVLDVVAAAVILWAGAVWARYICRNEPYARPRTTQTPLRARQLQTLADESAPIAWRR